MPYLSKRKIGFNTDRKEVSNRRNSKWNHYYQDRRWKRLREWQITNHPICYDCMMNGRSVPAEHVHHVIPFSKGQTEEERIALLLDPDNIVSLCKNCHDKRHKLLNSENNSL